jgi:hypothetical protein
LLGNVDFELAEPESFRFGSELDLRRFPLKAGEEKVSSRYQTCNKYNNKKIAGQGRASGRPADFKSAHSIDFVKQFGKELFATK